MFRFYLCNLCGYGSHRLVDGQKERLSVYKGMIVNGFVKDHVKIF